MRKHILLVSFLLLGVSRLQASQAHWVAYSQQVFSIVVVILIIGTGLLALNWTYKNNYRGDATFMQFAWQNRLVKLTLGAVLLILGCTILLPKPNLTDPYEQVEFGRLRAQSQIAADGYWRLSERFPYMYAYHYEYIAATYERDFWGSNRSSPNVEEEEQTPHQRYSRMYNSSRPGFEDISLLGMGISEYYEGLSFLAERQLNHIQNPDIPFRNLFLGRIHAQNKRSDLALEHYARELELGTAPELVIPYIGFEYIRRGDLGAMRNMVENESYAAHMPLAFERYLYTKEAELGPYFAAIFTDWIEGIHLIGLLGALGGLLVWVLFLRKVDIYKQEHWASIIGMVLLGGICTFAALPFYDYFQYEMGFDLTGNPWGDFLYSIVGIGFIEELVKIAPFLFVLRFTKLIRGPLDYIIYASLSGLGFAFVENLLYFDQSSIAIIHGRVLITAVFHMFASSTIAFGLVLAKYRLGKYQVPMFFLFFFIAAFLHGFYDFWLVNDSANGFFFFAYVVFVYATFQYASYINNCLNNSPIFRGRTVLDMNKLATYLLVALIVVLLFEYMALNLVYGVGVGNAALFRSLGMGSFLMFFVVLNLSYIDIVQGEWFTLRLWNFGSRQNFNKSIGKRITLLPARQGSILSPVLPLKGEIIARLKLQTDNRYFLLQFDKPVPIGSHEMEYALIKSRDKHMVIEPGFRMEVAVVVFRGKEALLKRQKERRDFKLLDYAVVK